jgi:hypothetical protein
MIVVVVLDLQLVSGTQERVEATPGNDRDDTLHQPDDDQQQAEGEERRTTGKPRGQPREPIEESDPARDFARYQKRGGLRRGGFSSMIAPSLGYNASRSRAIEDMPP